MLFAVKLNDGDEVVGTLWARDLRYNGHPLDLTRVIALDADTVFLDDGEQLPLDGEPERLSGVVELSSPADGANRLLDIRRITTLTRAHAQSLAH